MIDNKPTAVVLLTTKTLQLVDTNGANETFTFPEDQTKQRDLLREFVGQMEFKNRTAVMVLQNDLIWELLKPSKDVKDSTQDEFIKSIHVDPSDLVVKKIKDDDRVFFWATRTSVFELMRQQLADAGLGISSIVPINALSKQPINTLSASDVKVILNAKELITETDFLNRSFTEKRLISIEPEPEQPKVEDKATIEKKEPNKTDWQKYALIGAILVLSVLFVGGLVVASKSMRAPQTNKQNVETTPTPTVTTAPTPTVIPKTSLKIQILNGSGVTGQAAIIATSLKEGGYTNTSTANAPKHNTAQAVITFAPNIPSSYKTELTSILQKTFPKLVSTDSGSLSDWDATILTSTR